MMPVVCGKTGIVGVFGHPVTHSLSPAMHNAALAALGLPYIYVPFPVPPDSLGAALRALPALGIVGVNLTIPHKESALPFMDEITAEARDVGAVNTVHCIAGEGMAGEGRLLGDNTDGFGFFEPLREMGFAVAGKEAVILGAGGAARSVAFRLAREGARLCLVNRTPERAARLLRSLAAAGLDRNEQGNHRVLSLEDAAGIACAMQSAALLVNTTRVGMVPEHKAPPPVPPETLHPGLLVYDLVYNPVETELLKAARARDCPTLTGVKMLVYQGAAAFQRWTGHWPSTEIMERTVLQGLIA
jgi:shikimate dehydrogenase